MAKIKYYYNTETFTYEPVKTRPIDVILNLLGFLTLSFILGIGIAFMLGNYYKSDKEKVLLAENKQLKTHHNLLRREVKDIEAVLEALQKRDDNIYRVIFEAEPIPSNVRKASLEQNIKYDKILLKNRRTRELIDSTYQKLAYLKKQMYVQSKSYDEIVGLVKNKSKMLASMPAIQPISNKQLTRLTSGFGIRVHPIYKVAQFHPGIDFAAPQGTPIYATADGVVKKASYNAGYGNSVEINHGYGYLTLYAHMTRFIVKEGQKVKRGECIGYVGSTGFSTAPHVHYEVHYNGEPVNPVYFFFNDLTSEEYEKILKLASIENQSLS